jgi:hypothetical protein
VGIDDDPTDVIDDSPTVAEPAAPTRIAPSVGPTTPLTVQSPQPIRPVHEAARAPYMTPAPPQDFQRPAVQPTAPPEPWRPLPSGQAKFQRGCLLVGMLATVMVGFALAPYVSLLLLALAALVIRTISWTTEAARDRRWRRGRSRWYDAPLTVATWPWYLVVATGGTLMLLLWSAALAFLVGLAYLLFNLPMVPGLLAMGAVLAFSLWWGPGSRRLRVPARRLVVRATRWVWLGWVSIGALAATVVLLGYVLSTSGVSWEPQPGPPWRSGTLLGDLLSFI